IGVFSFRFNRQFSTLSRLSQDQNGDLATTIEQSVQGIRVLKAFGRGPTALEQFTLQADELRGTEVKKATAIARFDMLMYGLPEIATSISLLLGIYLTAHGHMNLGQLSAYFVTAVLVTGPVRMLGQLFGMLINTNTALDRYFEVMDAANTITDPEHPRVEPGRTFEGRLALHDVHFRYSDSPAHMPDLLDGVSLEIEPGETMALVGITGSGKSTLLQLVPRLYDVTSGSITIDGYDVRDTPLDPLHRITAFAFEDATLFSDSVRDNVLLGAPGYERTVETVEFADRLFGSDGTVPPVTRTSTRSAKLDRALELALDTADARYAYDLPEGVETHIGEEGMSLSGGQRQRLALARAIAAKPTVLLLDDPLSALDTKTEERVTERLREVLSHTTTLIVAHRTSTVALADRVALLEDGRITAVGTHTQLMASSERYRYVIANQEEEARGNRNLTRVATETGSLEVAEIREAVDEKGGAQ
ncbi:MAG: ABC transporter ATP-binding protein, partial [Dermabacter sp.]|nr:ABC transporter ATP-binding protein [Dermabacter sp.]